jgi:hypothetical protein
MRGRRALILGGGLAAVGWLLGCWLPSCGDQDSALRTRFARHPPERAFEFVFSRPVPAGVSDLAATGETWIQGTNVWITFRAPESVYAELVRGWQQSETTAEERRELAEVWDPNRHYDPQDSLGWKELYRPGKLSSFHRSLGGGADVTVWIDRRSQRVYVFRFGI